MAEEVEIETVPNFGKPLPTAPRKDRVIRAGRYDLVYIGAEGKWISVVHED